MGIKAKGGTEKAGDIKYHAKNIVPSGWLECNGVAISRTAYAGLFLAIGTSYGAGDGINTFNIPDLRGEFIRGFDNGRGVDSGRVFGSSQLDQMQRIEGQLTSVVAGLNAVTPSGAITANKTSSSGAAGGTNRDLFTVGFNSSLSTDARVSASTSGETRARNLAFLACIKY